MTAIPFIKITLCSKLLRVPKAVRFLFPQIDQSHMSSKTLYIQIYPGAFEVKEINRKTETKHL